MKTFSEAANESTCQKRRTICEIYDGNYELLSIESNRCNPEGGICHRLNVSQDKSNYDKDSQCNWTHAEINAINALPKDSKPYLAILYGHTFLCDNCESALKNIGIEVIEISNKPFQYSR